MGELFDRMTSIANLKRAWEIVAEKRSAPGVDQVSIARFARRWEENLQHLRVALRGNTYTAARLRHFFVPKASGGERRIGILTVTDRIAQRAALNVLDELYERRFLPCSYGYRRHRSVAVAVQTIVAHRDAGFRSVLDADIERFFESVDRARLLTFLREDIPDPQVMRLIDLWLRAMPAGRARGKGIALGAVISPLLANVYLHRLDEALLRDGWLLVRYADDLVVLCQCLAQAEQARSAVEEILAGLLLALHPAKTRVSSFDRGFDFLGVRFQDDGYEYLWQDRRIRVTGRFPGWLYAYGPEYE